MNETQINQQSINWSDQLIHKNLSEDVGIAHNDKEGLSPADCDIEPLWVAKEAKGMFLVESNHSLIGSNLKRNHEKWSFSSVNLLWWMAD